MGDYKDKPIGLVIQEARGLLVDAVGQIMNVTGLPSYIIDGILSQILSDIRQKELYDLGLSIKDKKAMEDSDGGTGDEPGDTTA